VKLKWLLIVLVALLYAGFRLWNLTATCIWFDEIFSVHAAGHSWGELFPFVAQDLIHPPLFYILLKIWILTGGDSLLWLRLFPALAACLALVPLILLCRELKFSTFQTAAVILFLAVNGSLIKYAQEVRMYSLLFCLACFSLWLFARWCKGGNASLIPLFLVNLLLIYTHYFGGLIVLAELAIVLWLRRDRAWKWLVMSSLWVLSFLPWVYAVMTAYYQNAGLAQNLNWAGKPGLQQILQFLAGLHQPFYFQQSTNEPWASAFAAPVILICVIAAVFLFSHEEKDNFDVRLLLSFCVVPLAIAFIVSWITPFSIWGTRHLTVIFIPYFLLVTMGLARIQPSILRMVCYAAIVGFFVPAAIVNYSQPRAVYPWCAWGPLTAQIKDADAGTIYVFEDVVAYELWFTVTRDYPGRFHIALVEDDPDIKEDKAYFLPRGFNEVEKVSEESITGEKFWIAVRGIGNDPAHPLWQRLKAKGYKTGAPLSFQAKGVEVFMVPVEREE
jgi:uncharacterized membrane protein